MRVLGHLPGVIAIDAAAVICWLPQFAACVLEDVLLTTRLRAVPNRSRKASGNRAWLENEFRVASFSSFKSFRVASLSAKLPKREIDFGSQLGSEATRRAAAEFCHISFSHL